MRALRWLFAVYLAGVLALTLWPSLETTVVPGWAEAVLRVLDAVGVRMSFGTLEALANVALFAPFGLMLTPLVRARRRIGAGAAALGAALAGCGLSAAIETAQRFIPGRVPVLQDVVMNTAGAAAGALVAVVVLTARAGKRAER